ncbi:MAG: RluA family pseudouridine synthase [Dehalococcoidia bacterium]
MVPITCFRLGGPEKKLRLDMCVANSMTQISRSAAQRLIRDGSVSVDGVVEIRPSHSVLAGSEIKVDLRDEDSNVDLIASRQRFTIVHEDQHLLILDKPDGLSVHPGPGHQSDTLVNGLLVDYPEIRDIGESGRPGIVHRIDRNTSGLMVVSRSKEAHTKLSEMVREHKIRRTYIALVRGGPETTVGVIDAPLGRDPRHRQRQAVVEDGRPARTHFRVKERLTRTTLMELELETGRTHQIRVHLSSIGNPVVGDPLYGRSPRGPAGLSRQFLHASGLAFTHPITDKRLELISALPEDLQLSLNAARQE